MKAYCITLKGNDSRQISTANALKSVQVDFEFFIGVDARTDQHPLLTRIHDRAFLHNMGRSHAIGEVGCYASHYLIWQKCIELNEPILVFEDHANIDIDIFRNTLTIAEQHIKQCGFIRLQDSKNKLHYPVRHYKIQKLVKYLKVPQGTAAYALSPNAARSFIKHSQVFSYPVDVFLRNTWAHKRPMFGVSIAGLQRSKQPSIIGDRKHKGKKNYFIAFMKIVNKIKSMTFNLTTNICHLVALGKEYRPKL
ncbi:glycosyltransferase family 25 protein [Vibrio sp. SBT000027]|uniref:glycosyltransferase family 25 protein n=1 Tax=Vibrio sp. SBT000027 TaxID=1803384 RepID=UPI000EF52443|nr:glycosyltransferase family 25 protein [Vibrio sp. SBT000027]RLQ15535.1 glycosyltransferase family 25 protein [Vibrio sp. SBT000027]